MDENERVAMLMDKGGSAIRFRIATELMDDCPEAERKKLADDLLANNRVKTLLPLLDGFAPIPSFDNIFDFIKIHTAKHTGIEGILPRLLHMGLREGIPSFDKRMRKFRKYVDNQYVRDALKNVDYPYVNDVWALFTASLLSSYFIWGGYAYKECLDLIQGQIDSTYKTASAGIFDIYLPEEELKKRRLHPQKRMRDLVLRPEIHLPFVYDLYAYAYLPADVLNKTLRNKINTIIRYILDVRFQSLHEGYGYMFIKAKQGNRYNFYGCGWRPVLPCFFNFDSAQHKKTIVLYLDLMSHFKPVVQSGWFGKCMDHLEQFRLESGTYRFPPDYLTDRKDGHYVLGSGMGLEDKRSQKSLELESTFWMLLLKKRAKNMKIRVRNSAKMT